MMQSNQITLEYATGSAKQYTCANRDSLLVSLLDAATTLGKNPQVHVSNVLLCGYCWTSLAEREMTTNTTTAKQKQTTPSLLFPPISIPMYVLKRVHSVSTAAFSYINSTTESSTQEGQTMDIVEECRSVVDACREFNAFVLPTSLGLPTDIKDRHALGSIGALWGLVAELLDRPSPGSGPSSSSSSRRSRGKELSGSSWELANLASYALESIVPLFQIKLRAFLRAPYVSLTASCRHP
jgi:hypothetical protein